MPSTIEIKPRKCVLCREPTKLLTDTVRPLKTHHSEEYAPLPADAGNELRASWLEGRYFLTKISNITLEMYRIKRKIDTQKYFGIFQFLT